MGRPIRMGNTSNNRMCEARIASHYKATGFGGDLSGYQVTSSEKQASRSDL